MKKIFILIIIAAILLSGCSEIIGDTQKNNKEVFNERTAVNIDRVSVDEHDKLHDRLQMIYKNFNDISEVTAHLINSNSHHIIPNNYNEIFFDEQIENVYGYIGDDIFGFTEEELDITDEPMIAENGNETTSFHIRREDIIIIDDNVTN